MSHKIVGIADSSDSIQTDYVKNQVQAIKNWKPELQVEFNNENCELLQAYCRSPARFPTYIILKNGIYKTHMHGKIDNSKLFDWLSNKLG